MKTVQAHGSYIGNTGSPPANLTGSPNLLSSTTRLMSDTDTGMESLAYPVG